MKPTRLWVLAALPLTLAACGGGGDEAAGGADTTSAISSADSGTATPPPPMDTSMASQPMAGTVTMNQIGSTDFGGRTDLMAHGEGATMVTVSLTGPGQGAHSGHIHQGTCESPGQVVAPLQDVTIDNGAGTSTSTVNVPLATVMNGQHIVAYHEGSGASAGAPVVCGQIPAQQGGAGSPPPAM